jgi:hypothetical protein
LVPILVIIAIATRNPDEHPVVVVDYQPVLAEARADAPYPVLAPASLPPQWRATRASWRQVGEPGPDGVRSPRNQWDLGLLAPNDIYIGLSQGDLRPADLIKQKTRNALPDGTSRVGTRTWERRVTGDGRTRALVSSTSPVTTVVAGDTSYEALESYAATLRSS